MGLDVNKMKKKRAETQRGSDFWQPQNGETKLYIGMPCRDDDQWEPTVGLNFIEVYVHYSVGKDNAMVLCLNGKENPIIHHPYIVAYLKEKGIKIPEGTECGVCKAIQEDKIQGDAAHDSRAQMRYLWWLIPIAHREDAADDWRSFGPKAQPYICGPTVHDGFMDVIAENGDITQIDSAILVRLGRKGKGMNTKYQVQADTETLKKPLKLDKATKRVIQEAIKQKGPCDLFRVVAGMVKKPSEIEAAIGGIKVDSGEDDVPDTGGGGGGTSKPCFGLDYTDDDECNACELRKECAEKAGKAGDEGEDASASEGSAEPPEASETPQEETSQEAESSEEAEASAEGESSDEEETCFGNQCTDDEECRACEYKVDCAKECGVPVPGEKPKPKKKALPKKGAAKESKGKPKEAKPAEGDDDGLAELEQQLKDMGDS